MSAGSGILHTVMSRTQAPPPAARPTGPGLDAAQVIIPLSQAVAGLRESGAVLEAVNIRSIDGKPWYQMFVRGQLRPFYVDARTGVADQTADERYAAQIASDFLSGAAVRQTDYLTSFNAEYVNIFRILPVYRFDVEDEAGTRVYVSTTTGSVTRHTDNPRQREAFVFSFFHKWMFIQNKDARDTILVLVTSGLVVASSFGIALFFLTMSRPRRRPTAVSASLSVNA